MKHWAKKCWQNVNADDETKRRAPKNTPAGQAWAKKQAATAGDPAKPAKPEVARKEQTSANEAAALLSQQAATGASRPPLRAPRAFCVAHA